MIKRKRLILKIHEKIIKSDNHRENRNVLQKKRNVRYAFEIRKQNNYVYWTNQSVLSPYRLFNSIPCRNPLYKIDDMIFYVHCIKCNCHFGIY